MKLIYLTFVIFTLVVCVAGGNRNSNVQPKTPPLAPSICSQPTDSGASCDCLQQVTGNAVKGASYNCGDVLFLRYAYDTSVRKCEPFTYYGCGGNNNNFKTKVECRETCEVK